MGLARKFNFKTADQRLVLYKHPQERDSHIWMKTLLWALYLSLFPELQVEVRAQDRFKPDLVCFDLTQQPVFWGEAGAVHPQKYLKLLKRYPRTHFAFARWGLSLSQHQKLVEPYIDVRRRQAPVDLIRFDDAAQTYFTDSPEIKIGFQDIDWKRYD